MEEENNTPEVYPPEEQPMQSLSIGAVSLLIISNTKPLLSKISQQLGFTNYSCDRLMILRHCPALATRK